MAPATRLQLVTYLLGVCLFSISFLVFLNASVSFVVTDLIRQEHGVGDAVGTLGFADELFALVACPIWGIMSDRIGSRNVCVIGYAIISLALFLFVQARNVIPQLLLARLLFSLGGAAVSTMVTAILPSMTADITDDEHITQPDSLRNGDGCIKTPSIRSENTVALDSQRHNHNSYGLRQWSTSPKASSPSRLAGYVGLFTGLGALVALTLFLPLPAHLAARGLKAGEAVRDSYYIVGGVAIAIAVLCFFGLRSLSTVVQAPSGNGAPHNSCDRDPKPWDMVAPAKAVGKAVQYGFIDPSLGLSYVGGFVARASSVAISLFIPLYVNAYFISRGDCGDKDHEFGQIKEHCRQAYIVSSQLTGASQLVALLFAPVFGYTSDKSTRVNLPLVFGTIFGIIGYVGFAYAPAPDPKAPEGSGWIFVTVSFIGISQIAAIVVSLGLLGRCVNDEHHHTLSLTEISHERTSVEEYGSIARVEDGAVRSPQGSLTSVDDANSEHEALLRQPKTPSESKYNSKGAIAGVYSLSGGAGILLLTKLGGFLFDALSPKTPFIMLAIFNSVLLVSCLCRGAYRKTAIESS